MAFVLRKKDSFFWPVKLRTPIDGGKYEDQILDIEFKKLTNTKVKSLLDDKDTTDIQFCKFIIIGWKDLKDDSNNEIQFCDENLNLLLDNCGYSKDIVEQFLRALTGVAEKN